MKQSANILLSGGGTGGHIYPAIAIADELKQRWPKANFMFVGAIGRMEMKKVPQSGYEIKGLNITGLQRNLSLKNLSFPLKLINSLWKAKKIIKEFKPDVVIGTGGFASGPTLYMANRLQVPTVIQEQNSYPGITNKLLAQKAQRIFVAYDGLQQFFPAKKIIKTGNPVRQDLLKLEDKRQEAISYFNLDAQKNTLVILGGSLGARMINVAIAKSVERFAELGLQVIWQTGALYHEEYKKFDAIEGVQTHAFIQRMDLLYAAADVIVSRAGAGTISELSIVGKPIVLIPSPNVAEDHQTKNAQAVINENAGLMVKESELESFQNILIHLFNDSQKRGELSKNLKRLALPKATSHIVDEIEKLIKDNI